MKRIFLILLAVGMLLSGCFSHPELPQVTLASEQTQPSSSVEAAEPETLLLGPDGNLLYIANETVESSHNGKLYGFRGSLLLESWHRSYAQDGIRTVSTLSLYLLDPESGAVLARTDRVTGDQTVVQILDDRIALVAPQDGRVVLLNEKLEAAEFYALLPQNDGSWYVSPDGKNLYCLQWERGLTVRELASGTVGELLTDVYQLYSIKTTGSCMLFSYVDGHTQRNRESCLDLRTGEIRDIPETDEYYGLSLWEDTWLVPGDYDQNPYWRLISPESTQCIFYDSGSLTMAPGGMGILAESYSGRDMALYDLEGRFLSRCALPVDESGYTGSPLVWSEEKQGFFFLDWLDGQPRLIFWDITVPCTGESLSCWRWEPAQVPEGTTVPRELYVRAREISQRFGVDIRIAEQCRMEYGSYSGVMMTNEAMIETALQVLEETMEQLPAGLFDQLCYGNVGPLQIELMDTLIPYGDSINAAAFVQENYDHNLMVIDLGYLTPELFYHELTHVIDHRLTFDATLRQDALFSEAAWLELQPEGFDYAYSYTSMSDWTSDFYDTGYFVSTYSMTYPTEDRATMMEDAVSFYSSVGDSPALYRKLDYYARCIRDCFDTEGWPDVLPWEAVLE